MDSKEACSTCMSVTLSKVEWTLFPQQAVCYDVSYGALTQLYAGTTAEAVNLNGKVCPMIFYFDRDWAVQWCQYLIPWARLGESAPVARDSELGKKLWTWLEEQVKDLWGCDLSWYTQLMLDVWMVLLYQLRVLCKAYIWISTCD